MYEGQVAKGEDILFANLELEWKKFKNAQNFTFVESFLSNDRNPVYNQFSDEYKQLITSNHDINMPHFINGMEDTNGNYCPTHILGNANISKGKYLHGHFYTSRQNRHRPISLFLLTNKEARTSDFN